MRFLAKKLVFYLVAAVAAITINFFLPRLIPGNPVDIILSRERNAGSLPPSARHSIELLLGLSHGSLLSQYLHYWDTIVHFQLGRSVTYFPTPVSTVISQALPWTIVLVGIAFLISFTIGIALGAFAGWKRGTWVDGLVPSTTFLAAIPYFWLALLLLYLLGSVAHVFPLNGGYNSSDAIGFSGTFIGSAAYHAVLPALTIVLSSVGGWLLGMRNMMVSTLSEDYILVAEAKGLPRRRILLSYATRNAVLPSVAGFAISLGFVVSGQIVAEQVFSYPGIGYTLYNAVTNDDYPLMQGIFLVITLSVLAANFLVDILFVFIDPRTRQEG